MGEPAGLPKGAGPEVLAAAGLLLKVPRGGVKFRLKICAPSQDAGTWLQGMCLQITSPGFCSHLASKNTVLPEAVPHDLNKPPDPNHPLPEATI